MTTRPGPRGHEFYSATTNHFTSSNNIPRRYEDGEPDRQDYGHNRYASENNHDPQDDERYYDHDSAYEHYSMFIA